MQKFDKGQRRHHRTDRLYTLVTPIAGVPEFFDYLRGNLYVPIEPLDLAQVMDFPAIPELKNSARQAQCLHIIGAALRDEVMV